MLAFKNYGRDFDFISCLSFSPGNDTHSRAPALVVMVQQGAFLVVSGLAVGSETGSPFWVPIQKCLRTSSVGLASLGACLRVRNLSEESPSLG